MMGWVVMLLLAAAVVLGMWRWVRRDTGAFQFLGAALLLALAGYAWQGRPGLAGSPKSQEARQVREASEFSQMRRELFGQFDRTGSWLTLAEALGASGDTYGALQTLRKGLDESPQNMSLWLGYADMLIQHAGGQVTPAAEMAFGRATAADPAHPAPRFFHGLALAKVGQVEAAAMLWRQVAAMPGVQESEIWPDLLARAGEWLSRMRSSAPAAPPTG